MIFAQHSPTQPLTAYNSKKDLSSFIFHGKVLQTLTYK